jgi:hypothetical protein
VSDRYTVFTNPPPYSGSVPTARFNGSAYECVRHLLARCHPAELERLYADMARQVAEELKRQAAAQSEPCGGMASGCPAAGEYCACESEDEPLEPTDLEEVKPVEVVWEPKG